MNTQVHVYRYNIKNENEAKEYYQLCETLKAKGLELFDCYSANSTEDRVKFDTLLKSLEGKEIELDTTFLFNNQWNTKPVSGSERGLRLMEWKEEILPNRNIKDGYYIDVTEEMNQIRMETFKCKYCGKYYHKPQQAYCDSCIGSEYLKEEDLHLLYLVPALKDAPAKKHTVPESMLRLYRREQEKCRLARLKKKQEDKLQQLQKDIKNAEKEYEAFKWLIEHGIDFTNVIYYSHNDTFCFGWRNPIPAREAEKLERILMMDGFAVIYQYEIKRGA